MTNRWKLDGNKIKWKIEKGNYPHYDDVEMSGEYISLVVKYGVDENRKPMINFHPVFPTLRIIPNNTHGSYQYDIDSRFFPTITDGDRFETATEIIFDGTLVVKSEINGLTVERIIYPDTDEKSAYMRLTVRNPLTEAKIFDISGNQGINQYGRGTKGVYISGVEWDTNEFRVSISSGGEITINTQIYSHIANEKKPEFKPEQALKNRINRINELTGSPILDTGNEILDNMYRFACIRAGESIFNTAGGRMHSPGGYSYYAATWCNDQIEYSGPFFAWTGDKIAIEASLNAYMQYTAFMSDQYTRIPCSVIAEGNDIWEGAGDRGDAAMYAYGCSLFALQSGDIEIAKKLWRGIEWSLEYCRRQMNSDGVVVSKTDELEGRFPTGEANLSTSCLYYGGLVNAVYLSRDLGLEHETYQVQADIMKSAIEEYFGHELHGFRTYRYYNGNETLRSWICLPLCMGIDDRAAGTISAMFSKHLWTEDGQLTSEGETTVWDRSTLYGFKGAFITGNADLCFARFLEYSRKRLLGDRVPYPIEAYPEGGKRHLSGESALYCRTVIEGLFGLRPIGIKSFEFTPRLPEKLDRLSLSNIKAFGKSIDIEITRDTCKVSINGETVYSKPQDPACGKISITV